MIILQAGRMKSGNFWIYNILDKATTRAGLAHRSYIQNHPIFVEAKTWELNFKQQAWMDFIDIHPGGCDVRISNRFREPITDLDAYIRSCRHVWTHSPFCPDSIDVIRRFDKVVYIIRDGRDAAISMSKFMFTPHIIKQHPEYESDPDAFLSYVLDTMMREWVEHLGEYLLHREQLGLHVVFYEQFLHNFDEAFDELLAYLGLDLPQADRAAIKEEVAFKSMKKEHPDHVRKGSAGQWAEKLSDEQKALCDRIAGRMMGLLNYPVGRDAIPPLGEGTLPRLPEGLTGEQIEAAMAPARRTFADKVRRVYHFATSSRPLKTKLQRVYTGTFGRLRRGS